MSQTCSYHTLGYHRTWGPHFCNKHAEKGGLWEQIRQAKGGWGWGAEGQGPRKSCSPEAGSSLLGAFLRLPCRGPPSEEHLSTTRPGGSAACPSTRRGVGCSTLYGQVTAKLGLQRLEGNRLGSVLPAPAQASRCSGNTWFCSFERKAVLQQRRCSDKLSLMPRTPLRASEAWSFLSGCWVRVLRRGLGP